MGGGAIVPPPPSPADFERWQAACDAAIDLSSAGKYVEALALSRRALASMEGAMGKEAEELLYPLEVIGDALFRSDHLDDAYSIMMRSILLCEKHHGEEGMRTCYLRTDIGEPRFQSKSVSLPLPLPLPRPLLTPLSLFLFSRTSFLVHGQPCLCLAAA